MNIVNRYISSHWKGNLSLGKSFWINFILLTYAFTQLIEHVIPSPSTINSCRLLVGILTSWGLIYLWQFVGCWRSARLYKATSKDSFSGIAVQLTLIGSLFYVAHIFPGYSEYIRISTGKDDFSKYQLKVSEGEILLSGYFGYGLDDDIKRILEQNDDIWNISLSSRGGRIAVAKNIAKLIKDYKIVTYTSSTCESACVIAFIAGSKRILGDGARIGLHSYNFPGLTKKENLSFSLADKKLYKKIGVTDSFIKKAFKTPADQMWHPSERELIKNHIITHQIKEGKLIGVNKAE
ncbi:hypothetical protein [Legionella israelensis]|uniref:Clp protease n=1 Tax=Legionella israelensis TaxID=454 RepID=A0A0W0V1K1_9GAMM|nr:hypothetical protein [Legionella israelensis]KTD13982.1 hypothetical protein Lisr_2758 [Legionella israelensis]QBS09641.1 hypothetical protein E4T55_07065 [Legionella israelensis]SCY25465.1 hypothetical protein SAMN02746069_01791 [Legionella israelensis DSM 19235]STX60572.1 Uncharacterised protein [Legionella israelensis]